MGQGEDLQAGQHCRLTPTSKDGAADAAPENFGPATRHGIHRHLLHVYGTAADAYAQRRLALINFSERSRQVDAGHHFQAARAKHLHAVDVEQDA